MPAQTGVRWDSLLTETKQQPLECLVNASDRDRVLRDALEFLESPE